MEKTELELLREEVKELKEKLKESEQLIKEISVPIIPSIIPDTILVPITGKLSQERFEMMISKIISSPFSDIDTIILDFTSISEMEIGDLDVFGHYIQNMTDTLNLLGVRVMYTGFTPIVTQNLVNSGLKMISELNTFLSFKQALQYLMKVKGMEFKKISG